ncbi:vam6/Vps39-like protein isoform X2 [Dreissena polymorpha]|uniref:vam6/Vps39-like protein isoform X2 n=1 Tax=Dreissena polymorpha TaxID=45954 RepID=UPI00226402B6|nr:vam6/Vps39-like protein isoform X2 [Dreissena polymorpha]
MDVYDVEKVLNFKTKRISISCIACHGDTLLVVFGKDLHTYQSQCSNDPVKKMSWQLSSQNTVFSKPVMEMTIVAELDMLIVLTDSGLRFHNLTTYEQRCALAGTEGATLFDVSVEEEVEVTKNLVLEHTIRLCIVQVKTIKVYAWNGTAFEELHAHQQLKLHQPARAVLWLADKIFVGLKDEYIMLETSTGKMREVFRFDSGQTGPVIARMSRDERDLVMLAYQKKALLVNSRAKPDRTASIEWTDVPNLMFHDPPYMVAAMTKHVEVNTVSPSMFMQQIDIRGVARVRKASAGLFVQTANSVYLLTQRPAEERVKYHRQHHQFKLAIQIQLVSDRPQDENEAIVAGIRAQNGVHLFCENKFKDAMDIFLSLNTDVSHVIGLFPDMLPHRLKYPERIPPLTDYQLFNSLEALTDFLLKKRAIIARGQDLTEGSVIYEHRKNVTLKTRKNALSVIDTTLLKCYVQTNHNEVAPLLRLPDNHVNIGEAERVLTKRELFSELIILYEEHAMHAEILQLLRSRAKVKVFPSPLDAIQPTIQKLQSLGEEHLSLIYEWAEWVFNENQFEALKMFTDDIPTVRGLPRGHILSYLDKIGLDKMVPIQYLEHVIYTWGDVTEELHQALSTKLRGAVVAELENARAIRDHEDGPIKLGPASDGLLNDFRHKLLTFIKKSTLYRPEHVLAQLPMNCLFEERALLLGRMGRHDQALGIYVYVLNDLREAEQYCNTSFLEGRSEVYLDLLRVYLKPPGPLSLGLQEYSKQPMCRVGEALAMLQEHASRINLFEAIKMFPEDVPLKSAGHFLGQAMTFSASRLHMIMVSKQIHLQNNTFMSLMVRESCCRQILHVDESTSCDECNLRIANKVFVRTPVGQLLHYACYKRNVLATERTTGQQNDIKL